MSVNNRHEIWATEGGRIIQDRLTQIDSAGVETVPDYSWASTIRFQATNSAGTATINGFATYDGDTGIVEYTITEAQSQVPGKYIYVWVFSNGTDSFYVPTGKPGQLTVKIAPTYFDSGAF